MNDWLDQLTNRTTAAAFAMCLAVHILWSCTKDLVPVPTENGESIVMLATTIPVAVSLNAVIFTQLKRLQNLRRREHPALRFCIAAPTAFWALAVLLTLQSSESSQDIFILAAIPTICFLGIAAVIGKEDEPQGGPQRMQNPRPGTTCSPGTVCHQE